MSPIRREPSVSILFICGKAEQLLVELLVRPRGSRILALGVQSSKLWTMALTTLALSVFSSFEQHLESGAGQPLISVDESQQRVRILPID
jgi:hypothetical protein